jgi:DNA-3-methyladenine glycosylase I
MNRCSWVNLNNELYLKYHDEEWGNASFDDNYLFEILLLESFQAGLSWECILNKREAFRKAFDNFNYQIIAKYDENKITELLNNSQIVRNKLKIRAVINNAKIFIKIQKEFGSFANYIWHFTNFKIISSIENQTKSSLSDKISQDLVERGMKFVGSVIIYSYLQAIGVINSHEDNCIFKK